MGKWGLLLCALLFGQVLNAAKIERLTALEPDEPNSSLLFHSNVLWNGKTYPARTLEVYNSAGTERLGTLAIPHSLTHIYPLGDNRIIVLGKAWVEGKGTVTYYTTVSFDPSQKKLKSLETYSFDYRKYQVNQFASDLSGQRRFFTNAGEMQVVQMVGNKPSILKHADIHGCGEIQLVGNSLFVFELESGGNVVRIDLKTNKIDRALPKPVSSYLEDTVIVPAFNQIMFSAPRLDKVGFVDTNTNKIDKTVTVSGMPRSIVPFGRCLAILRERDRKISIVSSASKELTPVSEIDLASGGFDFFKPRVMVGSPTDKTLFVRSFDPCIMCTESRNAVYRVILEDRELQGCF